MKPVLLVCTGVCLSACGAIAVASAPKKQPATEHTAGARAAEAQFWDAFSSQHYDEVDAVIEALTRAYLQAPNDAELALLLGHANLWKLSEHHRLAAPQARIVDHAVLARFYFEQARTMLPGDARILGWLGGAELAVGRINGDERLRREGYYTLQDGVSAFPEFNHFSLGYVMSQLPAKDPRFAEVVEHTWRSIEVCTDTPLSRATFDYRPDLGSAERHLHDNKRVCWNSRIAPHNFEGFFLHSGDVFAKAGDAKSATRAYESAKLGPDYASWPFRSTLEKRLQTVRERVASYETATPMPVMVETGYACAACHATIGPAD